jgi:hypothetical protein
MYGEWENTFDKLVAVSAVQYGDGALMLKRRERKTVLDEITF